MLSEIDPISLQPLEPDAITLFGKKYNPDSLKYWIDTFIDRTDYPNCPLTRQKIGWETLEKLGYSKSDFPNT
jgi:hypothetical protein